MNDASRDFSAKPALLMGGIAILGAVFGAALWLMLANLSGAIITQGVVSIEGAKDPVSHPSGGVVAQVLVAEGQHVDAKEPLIVLDTAPKQSERTLLTNQLAELAARRARLIAARDDTPELAFDPWLLRSAEAEKEIAELLAGQRNHRKAAHEAAAAEKRQLRKRQDQIRAQTKGLIAQRAALDRQKDLIADELRAQRHLFDRGLAQAPRVMTLEREAARIDGLLGDLAAQAALAEERIIDIELEILKQATRQREEAIAQLRDVRAQEAEVQERLRALEQEIADLTLRAPRAGIVLGLALHTPGAILRAAEPAMHIVPETQQRVITAQIDPLHIEKISPGRAVRLRLVALGGRDIPEISGQVIDVSADTFHDSRSGRAFFRATITADLSSKAISGLEGGLPAGMPVEVMIETGSRPAFALIAQPVVAYFRRAFRDG